MSAPKKCKEVSRTRRSIFAFVVVGYAMLMMTVMVFTKVDGPLASMALEGFVSLAIGVALGYIAGSTVDYTGARFAARPRRGSPSRVDNPEGPEGDITE